MGMGSRHGKPVLRGEDIATLARTSGMQEQEIRDNFDAFIEEYPDGKVKPKVFCEMMMKVMPKKDAAKMVKHVFRVYDTNSDGIISMSEMKKLIKDMYGLLKSEDPSVAAKDIIAKTAFAEMDKNRDGEVTTDEFVSTCIGQAEITQLLALKAIEIFVDDI